MGLATAFMGIGQILVSKDVIFLSGTRLPKTGQTFFSHACWAFSHTSRRSLMLETKVCTDNRQHDLRLTVRALIKHRQQTA